MQSTLQSQAGQSHPSSPRGTEHKLTRQWNIKYVTGTNFYLTHKANEILEVWFYYLHSTEEDSNTSGESPGHTCHHKG